MTNYPAKQLNLARMLFLLVICFPSSSCLYAQDPGSSRILQIEVNKEANVPGQNPLQKNTGPAPVPFAACNDLGGENGWGTWVGTPGYFLYQTTGNPQPTWITSLAGPPTAPRFNLTSGTTADPCTQGTAGPIISNVCPFPGFGNASIQLGQPNTAGLLGGCTSNGPYPGSGTVSPGNGCSERLTSTFTVTKQDEYFSYAYAIVIENPAGGHTLSEPFAEIYMLDGNGDTVDCSHKKYTAVVTGGVGPGFFAGSCAGSLNPGYPANGYIVSYRPWTKVGIDLSNYVGQTLTIVIKNTDCALGGHYCHSYWDFACTPLPVVPVPYCVGSSASITAPSGYTYQWSQNGANYTGGPNNSSQTITPIPQLNDTFIVQMTHAFKCDSHITYVVVPSTITPNFNFTGQCGQYVFTDGSVIIPSTTNSTLQWNFPGGTPASSTTPTTNVTYTPGSYTASLTITSSSGCSANISYPLVVNGFPTAAIIPTTPCLGEATTLNNGSVAVSGDPITSWNWTMPGGVPASATSTNTSTTYGTAGTHTVQLVVTSQKGCVDTIAQQVIVYEPPIANFSAPDSGCAPVCANYTDLSTSTDGTVTSWQWSFPGGTPATSGVNNPQNICYYTPGSYSASLIVTTSYGCNDTIKLPMIEVFPWPTANFCVAPTLAPTTNPVFNFCDLWSSDVVQWSWNFGDNDSDFINTDPVHSYSASATHNDFYAYNICIRVQNQYGCWDTTCKIVEVLPEFTFYIPNTFTPNGDFINEMFYGKSRGVKEYNIWIFDRWGNQIWDCHAEDKNTNWDSDVTFPKQDGLSSFCKWDGVVVNGGLDMGGNSGQLSQEDVYVWKVALTDIFDKKHLYTGHLNVVK